MIRVGDRIADTCLFYIFQACRDIADHTGSQFIAGDKLSGAECPDFHHIRFCTGRHHEHGGSFFHCSLFDTAEYNDTFVRVIF